MNTYVIKSSLTKDFSIIPNSISRDKGISLVAKGLLLYLLSNAESWKVYKTTIHTIINEKKGTVDRAFKELQNAKYIHSVKTKNDNNQFSGWTHYIYDTPTEKHPLCEDFPTSEISDIGKIKHKRRINKPILKLERRNNNKILFENSENDKLAQHDNIEDTASTSAMVLVNNIDYAPPDFSEFWQAYPRKTQKVVAEKAWNKLKDEEKFVALEKINDFCKGKEMQFIAHPSTYINQKRWEDEVVEPKKKVEQTSVSKQYVPERDDWV
jgi:hypothetical protein